MRLVEEYSDINGLYIESAEGTAGNGILYQRNYDFSVCQFLPLFLAKRRKQKESLENKLLNTAYQLSNTNLNK